jgi:hypothetical protein
VTLLWTEPGDVRKRWLGGQPLDAADTQITELLEDAEDTILREFPDIEDRVYDPTEPGEAPENGVPVRRVVKIVARMVIRHLRNPEGVRSVQEGAGPFQETRTVGGNEPGSLYLTDDERAELSKLRRGRAFSIDQTPASWSDPEPPNLWLTIGRTHVP